MSSDDNSETSDAGIVGLTSGFDPGAPNVDGDADTGTDETCKVVTVGVLTPGEPKTDSSSEKKDAGTAEMVGACTPEEANSEDNSEISDERRADTVGVLATLRKPSVAGEPTIAETEIPTSWEPVIDGFASLVLDKVLPKPPGVSAGLDSAFLSEEPKPPDAIEGAEEIDMLVADCRAAVTGVDLILLKD